MCLSECVVGKVYQVKSVHSDLDQEDKFTTRLQEVGIIPGTTIEVVHSSMGTASVFVVEVHGTQLLLRRSEVATIQVEEVLGKS